LNALTVVWMGLFRCPYTLLLDIGLAAAISIAVVAGEKIALERLWVVDSGLVAACGSLVAGRALYVGEHWSYYTQYPWRALRIWQGGLSSNGAIVGAVLAVLAYCAIRRLRAEIILAALSPGAAALTIFAWLACLASHQAYGQKTILTQTVLWRLSANLPDTYGITAPRVAVQWMGASWGIVTLAAVTRLLFSRQWRHVAFAAWLTLQALGTAVLTLLRADSMTMLGRWRLDTATSLALLVAGLLLTAWKLTRRISKGVAE